ECCKELQDDHHSALFPPVHPAWHFWFYRDRRIASRHSYVAGVRVRRRRFIHLRQDGYAGRVLTEVARKFPLPAHFRSESAAWKQGRPGTNHTVVPGGRTAV